ncbi:DNA-binding response regulator [Nocardioides szechwanensis]|uniref:DNA-binding response regulator, NarL/FixJ family, contains REC and HTH domains n=1 Tax=Nocardioides szechwanensis TaxID=1005944 RepID=A0A1H0FZI5_9ACTN|nr:response regulator transcription factor [Nocardioides szechwanensis]GEP35650.1 DNA-binding response regulator [Nocardioides szechwanensis]SDN99899.1 DNA-binding response regulator, NarL/FixJ family, contains REC and HTH domains [Nocardioides szechwanensis]
MSGPRIRLAIAAEQEVISAGLAGVLGAHADQVEIVSYTPNGTRDAPDVVLYDVIALHEGEATDLDHLVKETDAAVLAIARDLRPDLAAQAVARGADGCISMAAPGEQILALVRAAAAGELAGDVTLDEPGIDQPFERLGMDAGLTTRETEVLGLITQGLTNVEIAERLYLSINSVKTYVRSAYRRIGVTTRSQAVAWCIQHGFAPPAAS